MTVTSMALVLEQILGCRFKAGLHLKSAKQMK